MTTISRAGSIRLPRPSLAGPVPFRLAPVAALCASALLATAPVHAQQQDKDRTISDLQAEVARLKEQLARQQQEQQPGAPAARAAESPAAAPAAEPSAAAAPQPQADPDAPVALDTVVVRSRNRIEKLQDVPLSVSVVSGAELDRLQANDVQSIVKRVGNISWNYGNQRTSSLSIRGVAKQSQTEAQDPSVGVIVDGVSYAYNALISSYYFTDIDTVEVTRGPQGTLLGKNSSLGAINITTKRPSFTPSADWSLLYGQNNRYTGTLAAGGPVIDDLLAWRGSFVFDKGDGDLHDPYNVNVTYGDINRIAGRAQFLLTPTPDFDARFSLNFAPRLEEHTNGRSINTPTPTVYSNGSTNTLSTDASTRLGRRWFTQNTSYTYADDYLYGGRDGKNVNNDLARGVTTGSRGATAELNWNLGDNTLTSISNWTNYYFHAVNDDGTPFDIARQSGGFYNKYTQLSQELRLSSKKGGAVDWQTGLYLLQVKNNAEYQKVFGADAGAYYASTAQYNRLDATAAGQALMRSSLNGLSLAYSSPTGLQLIDNRSAAIFGQADWHATDYLTLTGGLRLTLENRSNTGSSYIKSNGDAAELNSADQGGFASSSTGELTSANSATQLALANALASKYFGVSTYSALTAAQKQQVADAKSIRASQAGVLFGTTQAERFHKVQPAFVLSPSYKVNDDLTTYFSWQYGEKAGISQLTNGVSNLVKAEKTNSFEVGFKSALLDKTLVFNAAAYLTNIHDYQQSVRVVDQHTTLLNNDGSYYYTTATGNVPKVQSKGIEIDGVYGGLPRTTIRFAGAYTDAKYKYFPNAAQPSENGYTGASAYRDVSGQTLPGASKYTFNIGVDWHQPVFSDKVFHVSLNTAYNSKYNSDNSLSSYAWIKGSSITDLSIGLGRADKKFDVSLLIKNVFDDRTPLSKTWNSYVPGIPRWVGVMLTGKL